MQSLVLDPASLAGGEAEEGQRGEQQNKSNKNKSCEHQAGCSRIQDFAPKSALLAVIICQKRSSS